MNSLAFKFSKVLLGGSGSQPRWRGCVSKVSSSLGFAVGAAYVETSFDEKAKAEVSKRRFSKYQRIQNTIRG